MKTKSVCLNGHPRTAANVYKGGNCRLCLIAWKKKNRERVRATARRWYHTHPNQVRNHQMKTKYGISFADYQALLRKQDRRCAVCRKSVKQNGRKLDIDHDHKTERIRGLLCAACNHVLGLVHDQPSILQGLIGYLTCGAAFSAVQN